MMLPAAAGRSPPSSRCRGDEARPGCWRVRRGRHHGTADLHRPPARYAGPETESRCPPAVQENAGFDDSHDQPTWRSTDQYIGPTPSCRNWFQLGEAVTLSRDDIKLSEIAVILMSVRGPGRCCTGLRTSRPRCRCRQPLRRDAWRRPAAASSRSARRFSSWIRFRSMQLERSRSPGTSAIRVNEIWGLPAVGGMGTPAPS